VQNAYHLIFDKVYEASVCLLLEEIINSKQRNSQRRSLYEDLHRSPEQRYC